MKTPALGRSISPSSASARARRRAAAVREATGLAVALAFACGLFALIALLDGAAQPDDLSPGTAFAATPAMPLPANAGPVVERGGADPSAHGTRPDAIR